MNQVLQIVISPDTGKPLGRSRAQYTGLTDLPPTERGERSARRLKERSRGLTFARVFTSPFKRAPDGRRAAPGPWPKFYVSWSKGTTGSMRDASRREPKGATRLGTVPRRRPRSGIACPGRRAADRG